MKRRNVLIGSVAALGAAAAFGWKPLRDALVNPCLADLPPAVATHPLMGAVLGGIAPDCVWDMHVHLVGTGDSGSGIALHPDLYSIASPAQMARRLFFLNAGCVHQAPGRVDASYVERMRNLMHGMPAGAKLLLFAMERFHDERGTARPEATALHVPDAYARKVARHHPEHFEWAASIHPYRADCVEALEQAVSEGARAIKWLPPAMGMDPASPACEPFYAALARLDIPLISHAGEEQAVPDAATQHYGNPLRLRRALDAGVRVVVAHCASLGEDRDLDIGANGPLVSSFALFARMMDDARWQGRLYGDLSAITLANRDPDLLRTLLARRDWHTRLLNGSDYPLPGVLPVVQLGRLTRAGLLERHGADLLAEIRRHNPLLFDFALKRLLRADGQGFPAAVFETRAFFDKHIT